MDGLDRVPEGLRERCIVKIAIALLLVTTPWSALAKPASDADKLRPVISNLRICVRSNAEAARMAGIQTIDDAVVFFSRQCSAALLIDLGKADNVAVPPGRFRLVIQQEWAAARTGNH
jgi:hypothetical protein